MFSVSQLTQEALLEAAELVEVFFVVEGSGEALQGGLLVSEVAVRRQIEILNKGEHVIKKIKLRNFRLGVEIFT